MCDKLPVDNSLDLKRVLQKCKSRLKQMRDRIKR